MADQNKFEEMLERLIAEDKAGAEELFHEIVVEKSREIYADLLESDVEDEEVDEATDEEVDESSDDDKEVEEAKDEDDGKEVDEGFDLDEFEVEADDDMDATDDMMGDIEVPMDGGDMDGMDMGDEAEGDTEERIDDLEDALEKLQQDFEELLNKEGGDDMDMGGEEGDDMDMDMDGGDDEEEAEEESVELESADDEETKESSKSQTETMREYVEKVTAKMGDTGTNGTKSAVAGKNDMGGTASNIAQSDTGDVAEAGAGGSVKGSALSDTTAKEDSAGNVNVPGGKASKSLKSASKPKMGDTGTNGTRSVVGQ